MEFRSHTLTSFVITALLAIMFVSFAHAQSEEGRGRVTINSHQFREEEDGVYLEVLFSLVDGNNEVVTDGNLNGLFRELSDNGTTSAQFVGSQVEQTEIFVVLALDMSGSMRNDVRAMKEAALKAVQDAPANTQFAIFQFSDTVKKSQFMSPQRAAEHINTNINGVEDVGTKLYDGVYEAIQAVNRQADDDASIQKAIIVFSDGHDEEVVNTGIQYSTHSLDELLREAADSQPLPIHTIGFRTNFSDALPQMAQETSGRFEVAADESQLEAAFAEIMNGLSQQWLATAVIFPDETGRQQIELEVEHEGVRIDDDFFIETKRIYGDPQQEAKIRIIDMEYDDEKQQYRTLFQIGDPDRIDEITIRFKQGGKSITKQAVARPFESESERMLDAKELGLGEYEVEISAKNINGKQIQLENGDMILQQYTLNHEPDIIIPQPEIVINDDSVRITLRAKENKIIDRFRILITDPNNELWFSDAVDFATTDTITVPMESLEEQSHSIKVEALDASGESLSSPLNDEFTYKPPARPKFFKRMFSALSEQPLFAFFLILALLMLVAWLVLRHLQNRSATGIPEIIASNRSQQDVRPPMGLTQIDEFANQSDMSEQSHVGSRRSHSTSSLTHFDMDDPDSAHAVQRYVVVSPAIIESASHSPFEEETAREIRIERFPLVIGRGGSDDELNALLIPQKKVSRQQAEINFDRYTFTITATNERNSVIVDGNPLPYNTPVPLEKGKPHRIRLAQEVELTLYGHESNF